MAENSKISQNQLYLRLRFLVNLSHLNRYSSYIFEYLYFELSFSNKFGSYCIDRILCSFGAILAQFTGNSAIFWPIGLKFSVGTQKTIIYRWLV